MRKFVTLILLAGLPAFAASESSTTSGTTTSKPTSAAVDVPSKPTKEMVSKMISQWPTESSKAAKAIMDKYGVPNETTESMLIWKNNHPWKRTIVMKEGINHEFPKKHMDVVQQFVDYKVPVDKIDDLAQFDGSLIFDRTSGELSARCDTEENNFLALNLAKEIIDGKKTVAEARSQLAKSAGMAASKDYTKGLKFSSSASAADPDTAAKMEESSSKTGTTTSNLDSSTDTESTSTGTTVLDDGDSTSSSTGSTTSPTVIDSDPSSSTGSTTEPTTTEMDSTTGETSDKGLESDSSSSSSQGD